MSYQLVIGLETKCFSMKNSELGVPDVKSQLDISQFEEPQHLISTSNLSYLTNAFLAMVIILILIVINYSKQYINIILFEFLALK